MALPKLLKNFNLFDEGDTYKGRVASVTIPSIIRKTVEFRPGGFIAPVKSNVGFEAMNTKLVIMEYSRAMLEQWGITTIDGIELRFRGWAVSDDIGDQQDDIEVIMRGRWAETNFGEAKVGEESNMEITADIVYFKYVLNDEVLIERDDINSIFTVGGVDTLAGMRDALAL